jgi:predicted amidohydrolase
VSESSIRVAIAQIRPKHLDLAGCVEEVVSATRAAAEGGAKLVVFGETVLPGYPAWLDTVDDIARWNHAPLQEVHARLRENAVIVPGPTSKRLSALATEVGVTLVVGVHEKVSAGPGYGTLFNSLLGWNARGEQILHHRKLVPTHTERLIWGPGDAAGLQATTTELGRVGGLICWEHWMPLARQALHDSGEDIHVALWPIVNKTHQLMSRHYAMEGRCFVLAAGSIMHGADMPEELKTDIKADKPVMRGGSCIIGPSGEYIVEPVFDSETTLFADLDMRLLDKQRLTLDVSGHYARPDVFQLSIDRKRPGKDST